MPKVVGTRERVHQFFYDSLVREANDQTDLARPNAGTRVRVCPFCRTSSAVSPTCPHCGAPA